MAAPDQQRTVYGPFYRLRADDVQDIQTIVKQVLSGELWGKPPRFGRDTPQAKGYRGSLPEGNEGFEFWAFQPPDSYAGPHARWWTPGTDLTLDSTLEVVKLKIAFVKITQSLH